MKSRNMIKKVRMAARGILQTSLSLKQWGFFLKGKNVKVSLSQIKYRKLLVLNDFVEIKGNKKNVIFGDTVFIGKYSIVKADFDEHSFFKVGNNFGCAEFCYFGCAGGVTIGDNVMLGQNVRFHAQNHNFESIEIPICEQGTTQCGIIIEDDCWFGSGSVVLDGVRVGQGSVIGANSVITKNIPPYSVVVGAPAKVIRNRKDGNKI